MFLYCIIVIICTIIINLIMIQVLQKSLHVDYGTINKLKCFELDGTTRSHSLFFLLFTEFLELSLSNYDNVHLLILTSHIYDGFFLDSIDACDCIRKMLEGKTVYWLLVLLAAIQAVVASKAGSRPSLLSRIVPPAISAEDAMLFQSTENPSTSFSF